MAKPYFFNKLLRHNTRTHLKNVDQGSGQVVDPELAVGGAGRRKSAAYTGSM
jgi:hypothetical protein